MQDEGLRAEVQVLVLGGLDALESGFVLFQHREVGLLGEFLVFLLVLLLLLHLVFLLLLQVQLLLLKLLLLQLKILLDFFLVVLLLNLLHFLLFFSLLFLLLVFLGKVSFGLLELSEFLFGLKLLSALFLQSFAFHVLDSFLLVLLFDDLELFGLELDRL